MIPWYKYPVLLVLMFLFGKTVMEGADSIVFCAAAAKSQLEHCRGRFIRYGFLVVKDDNQYLQEIQIKPLQGKKSRGKNRIFPWNPI